MHTHVSLSLSLSLCVCVCVCGRLSLESQGGDADGTITVTPLNGVVSPGTQPTIPPTHTHTHSSVLSCGVRAGASVPLEIDFRPTAEKAVNLNLVCRVRRKQRPITLNIKGEGYAINQVSLLISSADTHTGKDIEHTHTRV